MNCMIFTEYILLEKVVTANVNVILAELREYLDMIPDAINVKF